MNANTNTNAITATATTARTSDIYETPITAEKARKIGERTAFLAEIEHKRELWHTLMDEVYPEIVRQAELGRHSAHFGELKDAKEIVAILVNEDGYKVKSGSTKYGAFYIVSWEQE